MPNIKRTPLTEEQELIAERLKSAWLREKTRLELTQTLAAEALDITQGSFTQYLNKHIAVNLTFVLGLCRLLEIDPREIHEKYAGLSNTKPLKILVTHEWSRPLAIPLRLNGYGIPEHGAFGIKLDSRNTPYPDGTVALVVEGTVEPAIGYIVRRDGKWRFIDHNIAPATSMEPLSVLAVLAATIVSEAAV